MDAETPLVRDADWSGRRWSETPLARDDVARPEKKGPIAPEAPPRRRGVWKASLVAVAVVFGVAAVGWSRQGGDDFEFRLVGVDDDFDTGLPGGAWGEKLYECKNGEPTVPKEYKKGDWGSIAGDWYVIAGNVPRSDNAVGSCPQMKFELPDKGAHVMNQEMMYTSEGTNYWWNYTGNYQLDDYKGVWKNEDGDGTNTHMYSRFWSSVFAVGTYKGEKWFGWYFCGPAVTITRKGIPWILKESYEYDKKFEKLVKKAMVAAGVLKDGDVYYYKQEASCDYTWFHTGDDVESIHGSLVQYYEERNETTTEDNSRSAQ